MTDLQDAHVAIGQLTERLRHLEDDHMRVRTELHRRRKDWETAIAHLSRLEQRVTAIETEDEE